MTKKEAKEYFEAYILPVLVHRDEYAISTAWHMYTDTLCKDNEITLKQYQTWVTPKFLRKGN